MVFYWKLITVVYTMKAASLEKIFLLVSRGRVKRMCLVVAPGYTVEIDPAGLPAGA
jgi:hypothetical protein